VELTPTVLAILDDAESLEIIQAALTPQGARLLSTAAPEAGWDIVQRSHPDIILMDAGLTDGMSRGYRCSCSRIATPRTLPSKASAGEPVTASANRSQPPRSGSAYLIC
jgi:CheY-like chemotaxis protein